MKGLGTVLLLLAITLTVPGCGHERPVLGDPESLPSGVGQTAEPAGTPTGTPTTQGGGVVIDQGVTLLPGADGTLPVKVRWMQRLYAPETIAVADGLVYAADELIFAFHLADGAEAWEVGRAGDEGLEADGGVVIGHDGADRIRVWAPFNYDLIANRHDGRLISVTPGGGDRPAALRPIPLRRPTRFEVDINQVNPIVARWPDGRVAWSIALDEPLYDNSPAMAIPGGLVILTATGHLIALDYT